MSREAAKRAMLEVGTIVRNIIPPKLDFIIILWANDGRPLECSVHDITVGHEVKTPNMEHLEAEEKAVEEMSIKAVETWLEKRRRGGAMDPLTR
jgi:hypothetical protein